MNFKLIMSRPLEIGEDNVMKEGSVMMREADLIKILSSTYWRNLYHGTNNQITAPLKSISK